MYDVLSSPGFYFEAIASALIAYYAYCIWGDSRNASYRQSSTKKSQAFSLLLYVIAGVVLIDGFGLLPPVLSCISLLICSAFTLIYALAIAIVVMMRYYHPVSE